MGKSKAKTLAEIEDGGFVSRQSSFVIKTHEEARRRKAREAEWAERKKEQDRIMAEHRAKEKERVAAIFEPPFNSTIKGVRYSRSNKATTAILSKA